MPHEQKFRSARSHPSSAVSACGRKYTGREYPQISHSAWTDADLTRCHRFGTVACNQKADSSQYGWDSAAQLLGLLWLSLVLLATEFGWLGLMVVCWKERAEEIHQKIKNPPICASVRGGAGMLSIVYPIPFNKSITSAQFSTPKLPMTYDHQHSMATS